MKLNITAIAIIGSLTVLFACSKDTYKTKPTLKVTSVSRNYVTSKDDLVIELEATDKQGDYPGGTFTYKINRLNQHPLEIGIPDYEERTIPLTDSSFGFDRDFQKATFEKKFEYQGELHKSSVENDTINIYFFIIDRGKNVSDTVYTDTIVIEKS
ncbi:hypothetical protein QEG73_14435 [Chitinophagaceae bacterium 26-R-25]|nr:hypothetical protein [Chitinophagaceae bacterium 26-R-25]